MLWLTCGTPECGASVRALLPRLNRRSTETTWLVAPAVDPQTLFAVGPASSSSHAAVGYDLVAGSVGDIRVKELPGGLDKAVELFNS